jgi:hypothetical protein
MGFGGNLRRHHTGADDTSLDNTEIELLSGQLATWSRVERVGQPTASPASDAPDSITLKIPYSPKPPPPHPWNRYFRGELKAAGLIGNGLNFHSQGDVEEVVLRVPLTELEATVEKVSAAIQSANDRFEANEYRLALAVQEVKRAAEKAATEFQASLDERTAKFAVGGRVPWQRREAKPTDGESRPSGDKGEQAVETPRP